MKDFIEARLFLTEDPWYRSLSGVRSAGVFVIHYTLFSSGECANRVPGRTPPPAKRCRGEWHFAALDVHRLRRSDRWHGDVPRRLWKDSGQNRGDVRRFLCFLTRQVASDSVRGGFGLQG